MSRRGWAPYLLVGWLSLTAFDWPGAHPPELASADSASAAARTARIRQLSVGAPARAYQPLLQALDDPSPEVRREAARALGVLGVATAVPALAERLEDVAPPVRAASAHALGLLGASDLGHALGRSLGDTDAGVRLASLAAIAELKATAALPQVLPLLDDADARVRLTAAQTLDALGDPTATAALARRAADPVPEVRAAVLRTLASLAGAAAMHVYVRALSDASEEVALAALAAVGRSGGQDAVELLRGRLDDRRDRVARGAFAALALRPSPEAAQLLLARAGDPRLADLAPAAMQRMMRVDPALQTTLAAELARAIAFGDGARDLRVAVELAANADLAAGSADLRDVLLRELERDRVPLELLIRALAAAPGEETCARLLGLAPARALRANHAWVAAVSPCVEREGSLWTQPLVGFLEAARSSESQAALLQMLGRTASPRAAAAIEPFLDSPEASLRLAAVRALAVTGSSAHAEVQALSLRDPDAQVRAAAGAAYGALAPADGLDRLLDLPEATRATEAFWLAVGGLLERGVRPEGRLDKALLNALRDALGGALPDAVATRAADAAAAWGSPAALQVLRAVGVHQSRAQRIAAARALGRSASASARDHLEQLASGDDAAMAAVALLALPPEASQGRSAWLTATAQGGSWPLAPAASFVLARLAAADSLPEAAHGALCELASAADPHTAANAMAALGHLGHLECARAALTRSSELDDARGRAARCALGETPERRSAEGPTAAAAPSALPWLAVQYRDGSVALVAPDALGRSGAPKGPIWVVESPYRSPFAPANP